MKTLLISQNASNIWALLTETYYTRASCIKQHLNIDETDLFMAIGWLAHGNSIYFSQSNDDWYISNKQQEFFYTI